MCWHLVVVRQVIAEGCFQLSWASFPVRAVSFRWSRCSQTYMVVMARIFLASSQYLQVHNRIY
jgi:hypothetical protein